MSNLLIKNVRMVRGDSIVENTDVLCENGKITAVSTSGTQSPELIADKIIEGSGMYLAPGFIDLHIHGCRNVLTDESPEALRELCTILPQYGVTSFLPTICPRTTHAEDEELLKKLSAVVSEGADILAFMLEGHFLSLTGAITSIGGEMGASEKAGRLVEAVKPYNLVFSISPEFKDVTDALPVMTKSGMPAFITHTAATAEQTLEAIDCGAAHATHFFNVFPYGSDKELGVRRCGAIEAIMSREDCTVDFILDGEHVEPLIVKMALSCKGKESVCLITDASSNAGLPPGRYKGIGGREIEVTYEGGPARIVEEGPFNGCLAGSGLTMDRAVRNAVSMVGVDLCQAVRMASTNPARVIGVNHSKGEIKPGYDADMVLLDDKLNVRACWVMGQCKYNELG